MRRVDGAAKAAHGTGCGGRRGRSGRRREVATGRRSRGGQRHYELEDTEARVAAGRFALWICGCEPDWLQEVLNSYVTDPRAQQLLQQLVIHSPNASGYSLHDGLIRYKNKWIGQNSALQTRLIASFHSSAIGGHSGTKATYQRLKNHFKAQKSLLLERHETGC